jgi:type I restriction enzyme, S subunit
MSEHSKADWKERDIGRFMKLLSGFPFPSRFFSNTEGFPLIRIRDILDSTIETYFDGPFLPVYVVKDGEILVGMDGDFNIRRWNNSDALLNQRILKVDTLNSHELDVGFLFYWLQPFLQHVNNITAATTVKHLSIKDLTKAKSVIPAAHVQRKIGLILQTIDQAIEKTEALIEKYSQIKAGMMHDLFTRGLMSDGKLRPPRDQAPELYQETPIGWIPKEWELSGLRSKKKPVIPHLKTGPFGSSLKGEHWVKEGHPVITIGSLGVGEFIESELLFVNTMNASRLADFKLKSGDVVFSRVADVGRSVVIRTNQVDWIMSSNLMRISLDEELVSPEFLQFQLSFDSGLKRQIRQKVNAGGRDVANSDILNRLLFVWPSPSEQLAIVDRAFSIESLLLTERTKVEKLRKQKLGLMHDLLTGEVSVQVEEQEAAHV